MGVWWWRHLRRCCCRTHGALPPGGAAPPAWLADRKHRPPRLYLHRPPASRREILKDEETTFSRTLVKGLEQCHKMAAAAAGGQLAGADAFMLWDTYGFPVDLTEVGVGGAVVVVYGGCCGLVRAGF